MWWITLNNFCLGYYWRLSLWIVLVDFSRGLLLKSYCGGLFCRVIVVYYLEKVIVVDYFAGLLWWTIMEGNCGRIFRRVIVVDHITEGYCWGLLLLIIVVDCSRGYCGELLWRVILVVMNGYFCGLLWSIVVVDYFERVIVIAYLRDQLWWIIKEGNCGGLLLRVIFSDYYKGLLWRIILECFCGWLFCWVIVVDYFGRFLWWIILVDNWCKLFWGVIVVDYCGGLFWRIFYRMFIVDYRGEPFGGIISLMNM